MRPVIAMPKLSNNPFRIYMKSKYVQSLRRAGAEVRWIDLNDPEKAAAEAVQCDGLLLPGGGDVDPARYGQTAKPECGKPDHRRDAAELKMLEVFLPTNKPVLCICRGVQVLNVYFGGTLHQDIQKLQLKKHSHFPSRKKGCHQVLFYPHTHLHRLFDGKAATVNSMHHQAVDQVGPGLTVSAVSEDAFIEALEVRYHPFCVGMQWHPEHMSKHDPLQQAIFDAFVSACK